VVEDPRIEAGARGLCGFHGVNPDEPVLHRGTMVPMWTSYVPEVRAVLTAADAVDNATPDMERAGVEAMEAGSQDTGSLVQKIWLAMTTLRSGPRS
jgi:hypothetical protein